MTIDSYFDSFFQGIHTAESKLQVTERWKLLNEREVKDTLLETLASFQRIVLNFYNHVC